MKIAVVSPNKIQLNEIGKLLQAASHVAVLIEAGSTGLRHAAEQDAPDLMLVDAACGDLEALAQVEYVTSHHQRIAVVLLCNGGSPDFLIRAMRAGVAEVLPAPVTPLDLEAAVNRVANKQRGLAPRAAGKLFAFIACKGGSGATFLATSTCSSATPCRSCTTPGPPRPWPTSRATSAASTPPSWPPARSG
jgi:pilus assembly protein CpaE